LKMIARHNNWQKQQGWQELVNLLSYCKNCRVYDKPTKIAVTIIHLKTPYKKSWVNCIKCPQQLHSYGDIYQRVRNVSHGY
jgi:hypothetical protein